MIETVLHPRVIEDKDWATVLFIIAFAIIAITKSVFENRFSEFSRLIISSKYIKIYRDTSPLMSWFNIMLFFVQLLSCAFFILLLFHYFGTVSKSDWIFYIRIITFLGIFILSKHLVEKIIATAFNIEEFVERFNFKKVSYRTYIGLLLLPVNLIFFYNDNLSKNIILATIFLVLLLNVFSYVISLKNYQNLLFGKMFYFILYLCALEIAPYYFMYYWFTKS